MEDRNTVLTDRDITAHPELKLARWAARQLVGLLELPKTSRSSKVRTK